MAEKIPLEDAYQNMAPKDVWKRFYDMTQIPRRSLHEEKVRAYLVSFGNGLGLQTIVDNVGNVLIRKAPTPGMENRKGVILQAHMDMVADQTPDTVHDWDNDPIAAYVDNDWVRAEGTTLGADDGIGVALAMAVLESATIASGPLEALFTVNEEAGMDGATGLAPGLLTGDILINLDGEIEGDFTIGCAGGEAAAIQVPYKETGLPGGMAAYRVAVQGLQGGHSGLEINLGRGNAAKLLVRFLKDGAGRYGLRVSQIDSGTAANAIPRDGSALVCIPWGREPDFLAHISEYEGILKSELGAVETDLSVTAAVADPPPRIMNDKAQRDLVNALYGTPQGVIRMSDNVANLVETSTNMGVVHAGDRAMEVENRIRSSVDTSIDDVGSMLSSVWELAGAQVEFSGRYPGWKPNPESPLVLLMSDVYMALFAQEPNIGAVHAGLECGTIYGKYPNLDMISIGPTNQKVHTTDEQLFVPSVQKVMDLLVETLHQIPLK
ncbi:MAG: aminoacyl-histidine dipeptidase [Deltaproteobacteria bacterium]|nr:aminoacyl-histidine dipeptidase [Deltaproteobacteria bacterium]PWB65792.1 MAG: cytosol nonspecific dipeptidase [Deltaproteobacteria bacterium]